MSGAKSFNQSSERKLFDDIDQPLHGLLICTTGFSFEENKLIKSKIEKLGGTYNKNLLSTTHFLIIKRINTDKVITAIENNIKLVTKEWINENNFDKYLDYEKCAPGCFCGISLLLFGFNEEELKDMKTQIKEKDGEVYTDPDEADLIIVKSDSGYIDEEIEKLEKYESKIVTEKWYYNCISKNEYKPIDEKEDLLNLDDIKNNYEKIITVIESGENKKYIDLFNGKKFSIQGFRNEIKSKIIDIITFCSGVYIDIIVKSTNYVVVPLTFDNIKLIQKQTNLLGIRPNIVNCNWIIDSIKEGILLSPDIYRPIKSIDYQIYLSDIFKGESFCICKATYKDDKIKEIKEKIKQNMGEYFNSGYSKDISDFVNKYIIMNDGYPEIWNKLINENVEKEMGKVIISHRFLDLCLKMKKIIEKSDFFGSIPYPFAVPIEEFKNKYFYLSPKQFSLKEILCYDHLIKTFGGNVDELNEKTTHILFKIKEISQKTRDKMIKNSNENVKFIRERYFIDYILKSGACDINNYQVKIIVK